MKTRNYLFFLIISCTCIQCKESYNLDIEERGLVHPEIEVLDSVHSSRIDTTGLVYEVFGPKLIITSHDRKYRNEYPEGIDIIFYGKNKIDQSSISANYAFFDEDGLVTIKGDVLIESERGDKLETSHLLWNQYYRTLETDKLVRLIQASGDTTFGFGLEANEDFSRFQIQKGYAGKVQFEDLKTKLGLE